MGWNQYELSLALAQDESITQKADLFALSSLMKGVRTDSYKIPEAITEKVHLTEYGQSILGLLKENLEWSNEIQEREFYDLLLREYFFVELFIDAENTDHEWLKNTISEMVLSSQIRYPWVYGRQLYDKFAAEDTFSHRSTALNHEETLCLLDNTSSGVFQMGKYVVGPYGVIESNYRRSIYVMWELPLWHCSDPGCHALHRVKLGQPPDTLNQLLLNWPAIKSGIFRGEAESEWWPFLDKYLNRQNEAIQKEMLESGYIELSERVAEDYSYRSIPTFLHSLFSERECSEIFAELIGANRERVISSLSEADVGEFLVEREEILAISIPKLFQVSLLYPEEEMVMAIERCIDDGRIVIPGAERRLGISPRTGNPILSAGNVDGIDGQNNLLPVFNKYGVTLVGASGMDMLNLRRILQYLLKDESHQDSLEFMLEAYEGDNIREQMDNVILNNTPRQIVRDIFMRNKRTLRDCLNLLPVGHYPDLTNRLTNEQRKHLEDKILWKLGFEKEIEGGSLEKYLQNYEEFMRYINNTSREATDFEKKTRGFSSNYFSSLEQVLEDSIIFSTWALMKDHFADAHFRFPRKDARKYCESIHEKFDSSGENFLFGLVHLFSKLSDMISKLRGREDAIRGGEMPHWNKKYSWSPLIMIHKHLCLDLSDASIDKLCLDLKEITRGLVDAKLFHIRNRTTAHKNLEGGPFPTKEEISKCLTSIHEVITKLMIPRGLVDVPFMFSEIRQSTGTYDNVVVRNGFGNTLSLKCDTVVESHHYLPNLSAEWANYLILNGYRLRDSFTPIRFLVIEDSEFDSMWDNYPIRVTRRREQEDEEE